MRYRLMFLAGVLGVTVPLMYGQTDPATLHMGTGAGTSCATGCAGDPNTFAGSTLDIYQNASGANAISSGNLLLIMAVPTGSAAPSITSETDYDPYTGSTTGGTTGSATLLATKTNWNTNSAELYTFMGLSGGDNSNSFKNVSGAESTDNPSLGTVTSFTVYEYQINSELDANGLANIGGSFALGTYAIAYGCQGTATFSGSVETCSGDPNPYDTPFTEGDLNDGHNITPEPSAIVLLGSSMIGIGAIIRRRRANRLAI